MTLQQGQQIATMAKARGYITRARAGKVQFIVGHYEASRFVVDIEVTDWMGFDEAMELVCAS